MPSSNLVHVALRSDGNILPEFEYSDPDLDPASSPAYYVLAEPNQTFEIVVTIKAGFDLRGAHGVWATARIDNTATYYSAHFESTNILQHRGRVRHDTEIILRSRLVQNPQGEWMKARPCFGSLKLNELSLSDVQIRPGEVAMVGSIQVKVYRATIKRHAERPSTARYAMLSGNDELPEKALKGRDVPLNTREQLSPTHHRWKKTTTSTWNYLERGGIGIERFVIRYRTRKALQTLGCIENTPSPEPEELSMRGSDLNHEDLIAKVEKLKQENQSLRAKSSSTKLKRERDDDFEIVDSRPVKRVTGTITLDDNGSVSQEVLIKEEVGTKRKSQSISGFSRKEIVVIDDD